MIGLLFRSCAGGIVFSGDRMLLLKNEKNEWVMPKGVIRDGSDARKVAMDRVQAEAGVQAEIRMSAGETCYEFFSITRGKPVCNRIQWFIMDAKDSACSPEAPFTEAGFFPMEEALGRITYTQDRSLAAIAWRKYQEMEEKV